VMTLEPGDTVYIPACVPSRLVPYGENVQVRLKAEPAVREAVAWYCACGAVVASSELAPGIMQEAYLAAVESFNARARRHRLGGDGRCRASVAAIGDERIGVGGGSLEGPAPRPGETGCERFTCD